MIRIIGIAGSLRERSLNRALLRAAAAAAPDGVQIDIQTIAGIPLYDGDVEATTGLPPAVDALKDRLVNADGLLMVTPEYNGSVPGVLKNAVDWLSRPPMDRRRVFAGRPVAMMGATPGPSGTRWAQEAWAPVLRSLGTLPWDHGPFLLARAGQAFGDDLALVDDAVREALREFIAGFAAFVSTTGGERRSA
jgi:chromate reductase, NAD(P)H dehydrogenase (quinone)